jgi:hypothetical protein
VSTKLGELQSVSEKMAGPKTEPPYEDQNDPTMNGGAPENHNRKLEVIQQARMGGAPDGDPSSLSSETETHHKWWATGPDRTARISDNCGHT